MSDPNEARTIHIVPTMDEAVETNTLSRPDLSSVGLEGLDGAITAFEMMKDLSNDLGVSVLGEEARTIRKRSSYILEQLEPNKRAKIGADTVTTTSAAFPSNEDEPTLKQLQMQQLAVWKQTFRVERMVRLLSNLEEVMKLFIQELNDIKSGAATTDSTKLAASSNRAA